MAKIKYEGPYNPAALKPLIEKGEVYVECAACGAQIDHWVVIIGGKCPKCGQKHGLTERIKEANNQEEIEQANAIARQFDFVKDILTANQGCVYAGLSKVSILTGEAAFLEFVNIARSGVYTCLACPACGFIHIIQLASPGDIFAATGLYLMKRRVGINQADNWEGSLTCSRCSHKGQVHAQISRDYVANKITVGDPFFFISKSKPGTSAPGLLGKLFGQRKK